MDLHFLCFTPNQLCVAAYRACITSKLSIFMPKNQMHSVVYQEALHNWYIIGLGIHRTRVLLLVSYTMKNRLNNQVIRDTYISRNNVGRSFERTSNSTSSTAIYKQKTYLLKTNGVLSVILLTPWNVVFCVKSKHTVFHANGFSMATCSIFWDFSSEIVIPS